MRMCTTCLAARNKAASGGSPASRTTTWLANSRSCVSTGNGPPPYQGVHVSLIPSCDTINVNRRFGRITGISMVKTNISSIMISNIGKQLNQSCAQTQALKYSLMQL